MASLPVLDIETVLDLELPSAGGGVLLRLRLLHGEIDRERYLAGVASLIAKRCQA